MLLVGSDACVAHFETLLRLRANVLLECLDKAKTLLWSDLMEAKMALSHIRRLHIEPYQAEAVVTSLTLLLVVTILLVQT